MKKKRKRKSQSGFTLIEIMVVVVIIGMLMTLVGVRIFSRLEKAKRKVAVAQIRNFMTALESYRLDNGFYPTTEQGLEALVKKPTIPPIPKNYPEGGYLTSKKIPLDPWGNPYVYFSPGLNGEEYTIESYGADGVDGGEGKGADIESWHLEDEQ